MPTTKKIKTPPIVRASWFDAASIDPWTDDSDIEATTELSLIETVGFLMLYAPNRIVIAGSLDADEKEACCLMVIPRKMLADDVKVLVPAVEEDVA